jgi:hypothetical protein
MKKIIIYTFLLGILAACGETTTTQQTQQTQQTQGEAAQQQYSQASTETVNQEGISGFYVGMFVAEEFKENKKPSYSNKINIAIDKIENGKIEGHSVVAGNIRPFSGTATQNGKIYTVEAKEPGDDKYDGTFFFTLDTDKKIITGTWVANDKKLSVTKRSYDLEQKKFTYNKDLVLTEEVLYQELYDTYKDEDGTFEMPTESILTTNASNTLLKSADVANFYKGDLEIIRNAIYARHGYSFQNRKMRYLFDQVNWYVPVATNITAELTDIEKKNIDLLKRYEKHATKYYDSYGR